MTYAQSRTHLAKLKRRWLSLPRGKASEQAWRAYRDFQTSVLKLENAAKKQAELPLTFKRAA